MRTAVILVVLAFVAQTVVHSNGHSVNMVGHRMNYYDAMQYCESRRGTLVNVDSLVMQTVATNLMKKKEWKSAWIGINRLAKDSDDPPWEWRYHDLSESIDDTVELTYWGPGEPNNNNSSERCVEIRDLPENTLTANWNDRLCDDLNHVLCDFSLFSSQ